MIYRIGILLTAAFFGAGAHALRVKDSQVILDKLSDYSSCHSKEITPEYCQDGLNNWVEAHPGDTFEAAKLTRKEIFPWNSLPLFVKAFDAKIGKCGDEDVKLAVVAGLGRGSSESATIQQAKKILFQYCEKELKAPVLKAAEDDIDTRMNLCHELAAKKWMKLTPMQTAKCK